MGAEEGVVDFEDSLVLGVRDDLLRTIRTDMVQRNSGVQSLVIVVSLAAVNLVLIMDPATHVETIRGAVESTPDALGFVFLYDGHVLTPAGNREALLLVYATPRTLAAKAYPYERTPFGARFDDDAAGDPPKDFLKRYEGIMPPVV